MNNAVRMGIFKSLCYVDCPPGRLTWFERPSSKMIAKVATLNVLRNDKAGSIFSANIMHWHDPRVFKTGDTASLSHERICRIQTTRLRDFDGNKSVKFQIVGTPHLGEATLGDQIIETVTIH